MSSIDKRSCLNNLHKTDAQHVNREYLSSVNIFLLLLLPLLLKTSLNDRLYWMPLHPYHDHHKALGDSISITLLCNKLKLRCEK